MADASGPTASVPVAIIGGGPAGLHAAAVLFLAGPGSSHMLGAEIVVDGGRAEL